MWSRRSAVFLAWCGFTLLLGQPLAQQVPGAFAAAPAKQDSKKSASSIVSPKSPAQQIFNEVNQLLQRNYGGLSSIDRVKLTREYQQRLSAVCAPIMNTCPLEKAFPVLEAQLTALGDEHSFFETPEDYKEFVTRATGGVRLQFGVKLAELDGENRVVLEVVPQSAAAVAGLKRGDSFQTLNGRPYRYEDLQNARKSGHSIKLGVLRQGQLQTVNLTPSSTSTLDMPRLTYAGAAQDVAVLRIPTFLNEGVAQRVHDLVAAAKARGVRGMVVDLRSDTGGSLTECDLAVSAFVPEFTRVARTGDGDARTMVRGGARLDDIQRPASVQDAQLWDSPLAVLVDSGSASCSEFFAFEVQQARRGPIVGETTAGVGNTATRVFRLTGDAALQLTITNYVKPDGKPYPTRITPDIPLQTTEEAIRQLTQGRDTVLEAAITALSSAPTLADSK